MNVASVLQEVYMPEHGQKYRVWSNGCNDSMYTLATKCARLAAWVL